MIANSLRSSNNNKSPLDSSLDMILQQRNFYPILPNTVIADEPIEKTINVDYRKLNHLQMGAVPDLIITSSSMNPFVRKVGSTLFVNCSTVFKANSPGHFAKITSYSPSVKIVFNLRI
jgi:hypothetical protein